MHVAILGPSHPWRGGIAHHTASLYGALAREGHLVDVLNFSRLYPEIFFPGKTQRDESASAFSVPAKALHDPINPASWLEIGKELRKTRPDVLVLQWWHPFFAPGYAAVAALAKRLGTAVVMMCHNVEPHESTPVDRALLRLAYALPDRFVVQSTAERDRLRALVGDERSIRVAAHPRYAIFSEADQSISPAEARRQLGVDAEHLLVFFGLVRPYKGLGVLLEAVAGLPDELDWELIVAGEIYESADDYRRHIVRLGLSDQVRLEDRYIPNEEVPVLFRAADLCALPYLQATGSGAANVALACSTPLVMSRLPTLEQAFSDDPVEWFQPGDPGELREVIVRVLDRGQVRMDTASGDGWRELVDALVHSA